MVEVPGFGMGLDLKCLISGGPEVRDTYSSLGWKEACHFQYFCLYVKFSLFSLVP